MNFKYKKQTNNIKFFPTNIHVINISLLSFILINLRIYDILHTRTQVKLIYNDSEFVDSCPLGVLADSCPAGVP